jgi:hypothetical protein
MIRVTIELFPLGGELGRRTLGTIDIANDGSGDGLTGNYKAKLMKSEEYAKKPGIWKTAEVEGFPRSRLGPYDLVFRVLENAVGYRNRSGSAKMRMCRHGNVLEECTDEWCTRIP